MIQLKDWLRRRKYSGRTLGFGRKCDSRIVEAADRVIQFPFEEKNEPKTGKFSLVEAEKNCQHWP